MSHWCRYYIGKVKAMVMVFLTPLDTTWPPVLSWKFLLYGILAKICHWMLGVSLIMKHNVHTYIQTDSQTRPKLYTTPLREWSMNADTHTHIQTLQRRSRSRLIDGSHFLISSALSSMCYKNKCTLHIWNILLHYPVLCLQNKTHVVVNL